MSFGRENARKIPTRFRRCKARDLRHRRPSRSKGEFQGESRHLTRPQEDEGGQRRYVLCESKALSPKVTAHETAKMCFHRQAAGSEQRPISNPQIVRATSCLPIKEEHASCPSLRPAGDAGELWWTKGESEEIRDEHSLLQHLHAKGTTKSIITEAVRPPLYFVGWQQGPSSLLYREDHRTGITNHEVRHKASSQPSKEGAKGATNPRAEVEAWGQGRRWMGRSGWRRPRGAADRRGTAGECRSPTCRQLLPPANDIRQAGIPGQC